MSFHPDRSIQKALISTTSRLVGDYETANMMLDHAWPDFRSIHNIDSFQPGANSRSAYICVFRTHDSYQTKMSARSDHSNACEELVAYLSLLFGKRFDTHGMIENAGFYNVPSIAGLGETTNPNLPHNTHTARAHFSVPLNLTEVSRIEPIFDPTKLDSKFRNAFSGCCKFYAQALRSFERFPEVSYLHLITAGEIFSNVVEFEPGRLQDEATRTYLHEIRVSLPNGEKIERHFQKMLRQVKKRFVHALCSSLGDGFFDGSETQNDKWKLRPENIEKVVGAAYDLRSHYVHSGATFGSWVSLRAAGTSNEIMVGKPLMEDKTLQKVIANAPTFIGLERIIRACLLQYAKSNGAYLSPN